MRVRHDLLGCANRLRQTSSDFSDTVRQVLEFWRDERGARFAREDLKDMDTTMDRLVTHLQEVSESIAKMDRQLSDGEFE
jgi:hypothetical protein